MSGVAESDRCRSVGVGVGCWQGLGVAFRCGGPLVPGPGRDHGGDDPSAGDGGPAMTVAVTVTVAEVLPDGSQVPVDGELAAALAGPVEQLSAMLTWTVRE